MDKRKFSRTYAIVIAVITGGIMFTLANPNIMDAMRVAVDGIRFN